MCVIIYKPKGSYLTIEDIKRAWDRNSHGAGYTRISKETIETKKGFMTYESFEEECHKQNLLSKDHKVVMHFRIATHGAINVENCHPFYNKKGTRILYHNGMVCGFGSKDLSDTKDFFESIISKITPEATIKLLELAGSSARYLMIEDGNIEMYGNWVKRHGCHYSNSFSFPYEAPKTTYGNIYPVKYNQKSFFDEDEVFDKKEFKRYNDSKLFSEDDIDEEELDIPIFDFCEDCGEPCSIKTLETQDWMCDLCLNNYINNEVENISTNKEK